MYSLELGDAHSSMTNICNGTTSKNKTLVVNNNINHNLNLET